MDEELSKDMFKAKGFHFYSGEEKWLARGVTYGCGPASVRAWPDRGAMALGATGGPPSTAESRKALRQLEQDCLPRQQKYEAQAQTLAGRNS